MNRIASGTMLILFLVGSLSLVFNIPSAKAMGTIYIRADGSIDPPTAPILTADNVTYTLTDNINDTTITVERGNIMIDGNSHTLQGSDTGYGFYLSDMNNVRIQNTIIKNFSVGVQLSSSSNIAILRNNITDNGGYGSNGENFWMFGYGVQLSSSYNNTISENYIVNNGESGVDLSSSYNNTISRNIITNNGWNGVSLDSSNYNTFSGNTIANNKFFVSYGYYEWYGGDGIWLYSSSNNTILGNRIANNGYLYIGAGVDFWLSSCNILSGNYITNNIPYGVWLGSSSYNKVYNNNFDSNQYQVYDAYWDYPQYYPPSVCTWDDNYPRGGNYWSNYAGADLKRGPNQDQLGSDGIIDVPFVIDARNRDRYPLMRPWPSGPATHELEVNLRTSMHLHPGNSSLVEATVANKGFNVERSVVFYFWLNGSIVNSTTISLLYVGSSFTLKYLWVPIVEGKFNLTAYAVPVSLESYLANNRKIVFPKVSIEDPVQNMDTELYYDTIQEAIDASMTLDGHRIMVDEGTYFEHLIINKTLKIIGKDRTNTIIDGSNTGSSVVQITANFVVLNGFTIQDGNMAPTAAIALFSSNNLISSNIIINNGYGIYLSNAQDNTILSNIITNNAYANNVYGIYLEYADANIVSNNTISNHQQAGIYVRESMDNIFTENIVQKNRDAVVLDGDYYYPPLSNNKLYHNNFIDNTSPGFTQNAYDNKWDDGYSSGGNYWSDYNGTDSDGDGIGDSPYVIDASNQDNYPLMHPYIPGDCNHDGEVNMTDANMVMASWLSIEGDLRYYPSVDFNKDKIINILDATIVGWNWLKHA